MYGDTPGTYADGIYRKGDVRISDLSGCKRLPIGNSNFLTVAEKSVFIDKSMLIADLIDSGSLATLYCRPRRFGKSLNLDMLQRFFEEPSLSDPSAMDTAPLFSRLAIWDAGDGRYRIHHQKYPVVRLSFGDIKEPSWDTVTDMVGVSIAAECSRHRYLATSDKLGEGDRAWLENIMAGQAGDIDIKTSLKRLTRLLYQHHGRRVVVLIDEYDAPIMAGYTSGYYDAVVGFLKSWLTGALKGNDALELAVLTGVQRISKESIFSDLNNLTVNTSLNVVSDERYGFTQAEIDALAEYLGCSYARETARAWYDGYRFGTVDVYNPWSMLNYFNSGCTPDIYWGNTSGNSILGDMVRRADNRTWAKLYQLMEPKGALDAALDLGVVFPDVGIRPGALWSMLYLAGYLTTGDIEQPNSTTRMRRLSIPNCEIRQLYKSEIIERFSQVAGDRERLSGLHEALLSGDAALVQEELSDILLNSVSYFDLAREASYHMLLLGLLFGIPGYLDPVSNREAGRGRFDILVASDDSAKRAPLVLELKYARPGQARSEQGGADDSGEDGAPAALRLLADSAVSQIEDRGYAPGAIAYGVAFSGKLCAVAGGKKIG